MVKKKQETKSSKKFAIRSMTGFGKGQQDSPGGKITVEVKSLNHKNLSITCNPFNGIFFLEENVKKIFEKQLYRGKVFIRISREEKTPGTFYKNIRVNENVAKEYLKKVMALKKTLKVSGEIEIRDILQFPGVIENDYEGKADNSWKNVEKALKNGLKSLMEYRLNEGQALAKDFLSRVKNIEKKLSLIQKYEKQSVDAYRKKIKLTFDLLPQDKELIKNKLEEDVAVFARNCDIAEETTRLSGHLIEFQKTVQGSKKDAGKKLDFIAQEMQREINTIGAKAASFNISKAVIEVKSEIEKIREQVRNIE